MGEDIRFIATFGFDKDPSTVGAVVHIGDSLHYTLNGSQKPRICGSNELLVVDSVKVSDSGCMLAGVALVIDGLVVPQWRNIAIQPHQALGVQVVVKRLSEMVNQKTVIDYPVDVEIYGTRYLLNEIENIDDELCQLRKLKADRDKRDEIKRLRKELFGE